MRNIAVTGSVATDNLMTFKGRLAELILPEQIQRLSLSFLVDSLDIRAGGVAVNICFGMAQFGLRPLLVAAVGLDWEEDRARLDGLGVDTSALHVSTSRPTARFFCTTDQDQNQIASFFPGAMSEASEIALAPVAEAAGGLDLVLVSPNDPAAMLRHTDDARSLGVAFAADPSQQLAILDGDQIRSLVSGARFLLANDYEMALIESKTGWSHDDVLGETEVCVVTRGASGCSIEAGGERWDVPAVPVEREVDPTGVGDAFRAGFLTGQARGLGLERSAQMGATLAAYVLETTGPVEYSFERTGFRQRLAATYGEEAAAEIDA